MVFNRPRVGTDDATGCANLCATFASAVAALQAVLAGRCLTENCLRIPSSLPPCASMRAEKGDNWRGSASDKRWLYCDKCLLPPFVAFCRPVLPRFFPQRLMCVATLCCMSRSRDAVRISFGNHFPNRATSACLRCKENGVHQLICYQRRQIAPYKLRQRAAKSPQCVRQIAANLLPQLGAFCRSLHRHIFRRY